MTSPQPSPSADKISDAEVEAVRLKISEALFGKGNDRGNPLAEVADALIALAEAATRRAQSAVVGEPDHCYDPDDWEYTMPWEDRNELVDSWQVNEVHRVSTLIDGPNKWVVLCWDEVNGEEIRWFDTEEDAKAAIAQEPTP